MEEDKLVELPKYHGLMDKHERRRLFLEDYAMICRRHNLHIYYSVNNDVVGVFDGPGEDHWQLEIQE